MSHGLTTGITITGNIKVIVPASTQYMTTFVLQEQRDWFEDEIHFVRHFIKPGMNVIDIGANHGLYTLTFANIIGDSGKVWAFEPTMATAELLRMSIKENRFNNVTLIQSGLSDKAGTAELYTSPNSELNSLSKEAVPGEMHETISLKTLDECLQEYNWSSIDFIKLDAEGEEDNILKAGIKMLTDLSPLIMFELKHGENVNLPLINRFRSMGYNCYRFLPGLNVLVPFNPEMPFDGYLLNLFCCKSDKAEQLEKDGIIVSDWEDTKIENKDLAEEYISKFPFYRSISTHSTQKLKERSDIGMVILNLYIKSLTESSSQEKLSYLMSALSRTRDMLANKEQRIEWLVVAARVAFDAGERVLGVNILSELIKQHKLNQTFELEELLLPASRRYEQIDPQDQAVNWLWASIYEQCIVKHAFSSYFTKSAALPLYEQLNTLGFMSEEMDLRYQLVKSSFAS